MNSIPILIVLLLTLYVGFAQLDQISVQLGFYSPLFAATVTGLLMGDVTMGLSIGASMQLMTLGVATYGGATVPDFLSGSIMGTAFAIMSGQGAEYGVALAVPIGLLLTQLDVFGRMANVVFQHRAERCAEKGDDKGVELSNILGILPWTLTRMIPVFVGLFFGEAVVTAINERPEVRRRPAPRHGYRPADALPAHEEVLPLLHHWFCTDGLPARQLHHPGRVPGWSGPGCHLYVPFRFRRYRRRGCRQQRPGGGDR